MTLNEIGIVFEIETYTDADTQAINDWIAIVGITDVTIQTRTTSTINILQVAFLSAQDALLFKLTFGRGQL